MQFGPGRMAAAGLVAMALLAPADAAVIHVSPDGNDHSDGLSWASPKRTIGAGIAAAAASAPGEVWVVQGTYAERITMADGVAVYGGFRGDEGSAGDRKADPALTVIDGGAGGAVVTAQAGVSPSAVLDGFTVRNGKGFAGLGTLRYGGGIMIANASPTIHGCIITGNSALGSSSQGGGIYITGATGSAAPVITGNTITGNTCGYQGGGVYTEFASPAFSGNTISSNTARSGGGFYAAYTGTAAFTGNVIQGNVARFGAGGYVYADAAFVADNAFVGNDARSALLNDGYGGGLFVYFVTTPTIERNTFSGNLANYGAGLAIRQGSPAVQSNVVRNNAADVEGGGVWVNGDYANPTYTARPLIANNTVTGNTAPTGGGMHFTLRCAPRIVNNVVAFNGSGLGQATGAAAALNNNDVFGNNGADYAGLAPGANDIAADPLFYNSQAGNVRLTASSPCVDRGDNSVAAGADRDGQARVQGGTVDLGAYEAPPRSPFSVADAGTALKIAAGLSSASVAESLRLNVAVDGPSLGRVDACDVALLIRKAAGLDPNP